MSGDERPSTWAVLEAALAALEDSEDDTEDSEGGGEAFFARLMEQSNRNLMEAGLPGYDREIAPSEFSFVPAFAVSHGRTAVVVVTDMDSGVYRVIRTCSPEEARRFVALIMDTDVDFGGLPPRIH